MSEEGFDELIHNPVRLRLCVLLMPAHELHFAVLRDELAVADSVLSKHLKALADAGHVSLQKVGRPSARPVTAVGLTEQGRRAVTAHLEALQRLVQQAATSHDSSQGGHPGER